MLVVIPVLLKWPAFPVSKHRDRSRSPRDTSFRPPKTLRPNLLPEIYSKLLVGIRVEQQESQCANHDPQIQR
jgi:hypothetical protein